MWLRCSKMSMAVISSGSISKKSPTNWPLVNISGRYVLNLTEKHPKLWSSCSIIIPVPYESLGKETMSTLCSSMLPSKHGISTISKKKGKRIITLRSASSCRWTRIIRLRNTKSVFSLPGFGSATRAISKIWRRKCRGRRNLSSAISGLPGISISWRLPTLLGEGPTAWRLLSGLSSSTRRTEWFQPATMALPKVSSRATKWVANVATETREKLLTSASAFMLNSPLWSRWVSGRQWAAGCTQHTSPASRARR